MILSERAESTPEFWAFRLEPTRRRPYRQKQELSGELNCGLAAVPLRAHFYLSFRFLPFSQRRQLFH
jgi:hypothetical protein